jgi:hypothetical protein
MGYPLDSGSRNR